MPCASQERTAVVETYVRTESINEARVIFVEQFFSGHCSSREHSTELGGVVARNRICG
jgi:hypothetical protein